LLARQQNADLTSIAQSRSLPPGYVFRAKLILMLAEGASFNAIKRRLQTTAPSIVRSKQRFRRSGLEGLDTYHPSQKPTTLLRVWQYVPVAFLFVPLTPARYVGLPAEKTNAAAGLMNFMRNIGQSVGTSVVTTLIARRFVLGGYYHTLRYNN
jgi:hypothetical protein